MRNLVILLTLCAATAAFAHGGVKNPAVQARMTLMEQVADATKRLGAMAKGTSPFDAAKATAAKTALATAAAQVAPAFQAPESDPKSEALPAIWQDWPAFLSQAEAMETATQGLDVTSLDTLRASFGAVGQSCGGCHERFRLKK